ncbi:MAG: hypothetical protein E6Q97_02635 [Desulfurellales bacterium]|nr:MAG: hypothetical protein E6Q97_02635 [Desulfurellales bacterium]
MTPGIWQRWPLERVAELGPVMPGWKRGCWVARLRQLADTCEKNRAELATIYRRWADVCETKKPTA